MQDKPTAEELLESIQEFLMKDVLPEVKENEFLAYKTLVSWNMLGVIGREIRDSGLIQGRIQDQVRSKELARKVRESKHSPEDIEIWEEAKALVAKKVRISNPKILL